MAAQLGRRGDTAKSPSQPLPDDKADLAAETLSRRLFVLKVVHGIPAVILGQASDKVVVRCVLVCGPLDRDGRVVGGEAVRDEAVLLAQL